MGYIEKTHEFGKALLEQASSRLLSEPECVKIIDYAQALVDEAAQPEDRALVRLLVRDYMLEADRRAETLMRKGVAS